MNAIKLVLDLHDHYESLRNNPDQLIGTKVGDYRIEQGIFSEILQSDYDLFYLSKAGTHYALARVFAPKVGRPETNKELSEFNFSPLEAALYGNRSLNDFISEVEQRYAGCSNRECYLPDYLLQNDIYVSIESIPTTTLALARKNQCIKTHQGIVTTEDTSFYKDVLFQKIVDCLLNGLTSIHSHKITHGNIIPENMWVYSNRTIKLTNFDIGYSNLWDKLATRRIVAENSSLECIPQLKQSISDQRQQLLREDVSQMRFLLFSEVIRSLKEPTYSFEMLDEYFQCLKDKAMNPKMMTYFAQSLVKSLNPKREGRIPLLNSEEEEALQFVFNNCKKLMPYGLENILTGEFESIRDLLKEVPAQFYITDRLKVDYVYDQVINKLWGRTLLLGGAVLGCLGYYCFAFRYLRND